MKLHRTVSQYSIVQELEMNLKKARSIAIYMFMKRNNKLMIIPSGNMTHIIEVRPTLLFIRKIYHRGVWLVSPLLSSQHSSPFVLHHLAVQIIAFHHCHAYLQLSRCSWHHNPYWHNRWLCAGEHMLAIAPLCNQFHYFFMGCHRLMFPYLFSIRYKSSLIWSGLKCLIMRRKTVAI